MAEAYLTAADELSARRILNAHFDILENIWQAADWLSRRSSMRRTRQVRRRLALLRQAAKIGTNTAFFDAAERKRLPFPLRTDANHGAKPAQSTWTRVDFPPLLLEAINTAGDNLDDIATNQAALKRVIEAWEKVRAATSFGGSPGDIRAIVLNHLALARIRLFDLVPDAENLGCIIEVLREGLSSADGDPYTDNLRNNLALAYHMRYRMTGALDDLEESLQVRDRLVDETPIGHAEMWKGLNNYANSVWAVYQKTGSSGLADRARVYYEHALRWCPPDDPKRAGIESNLADVYTGLRQHAIVARRVKDTDRFTKLALRHGRNAAEMTPSDSPDYPRHILYYARALDAAGTFLRSGRQQRKYAESLRYLELAIEHCPPSSREFPLLLAEYIHIGRRTDSIPAAKIAEHYREACRRGLEISPSVVRHVATSWAHTAARSSAWSEAAEAWQFAQQAMQLLFHAQTLRGHQETWLREFASVPTEAASAAAKANDLVGAVVALERGRAMILSESLSRELADLDQIAGEGHTDETERFQSAAAELGRMQAMTASIGRGIADPAGSLLTESLRNQLQAARHDFDEAVAAVQRLPGRRDFLRSASYEDIAHAARTAPIVYLVAATGSGMALRVSVSGEVQVTFLPDLSDIQLDIRAGRFTHAYQRRERDPRAWRDQLDETCRWVWTAVLGPCLDDGLIADRAVLVPTGKLAALPLHAAWRPDDAAPSGRRYAIDEAFLTYAPSAQAITAATRRISDMTVQSVLVVADPSPVSAASLPGAAAEADAATSVFPECERLEGAAATRQAIVDALPGYQVHHMACHAKADTANPLQSALLLANDEALTLSDIMKMTLRHPRLSFLSACETAVIGEKLPNEVIGLHTALVQAGMPGVVGSLWAVLDESTAVLALRFYDLWRNQGIEPPAALREAQIWLRDATNGEIASFSGLAPKKQLGDGAYKLWESAREPRAPAILGGVRLYRRLAFGYYYGQGQGERGRGSPRCRQVDPRLPAVSGRGASSRDR